MAYIYLEDKTIASVEEFLFWEQSSLDVIAVKRLYIDIADDLVAGVLLSQIIYWHLPNVNGDSKLKVAKEGRFWIAKKREDWWKECRLTGKQCDRAMANLEEKGLITTRIFKFNGNPTKHIALNWDIFIEEISKVIDLSLFHLWGKSNLPKGENPFFPKGKMDLDERAKSITKITTKTTSETTTTAVVDHEKQKGTDKKVITLILAELSRQGFTITEDLIRDLIGSQFSRDIVLYCSEYMVWRAANGSHISRPDRFLTKICKEVSEGTFQPGRFISFAEWKGQKLREAQVKARKRMPIERPSGEEIKKGCEAIQRL